MKQTHSRNRKYNERKQAHTQETPIDKTDTSKFKVQNDHLSASGYKNDEQVE